MYGILPISSRRLFPLCLGALILASRLLMPVDLLAAVKPLSWERKWQESQDRLKADPGNPVALADAGVLSFFFRHNMEESIGYFAEALKRKPNDGRSALYLAYIHWISWDYERFLPYALISLQDRSDPLISGFSLILLSTAFNKTLSFNDRVKPVLEHIVQDPSRSGGEILDRAMALLGQIYRQEKNFPALEKLRLRSGVIPHWFISESWGKRPFLDFHRFFPPEGWPLRPFYVDESTLSPKVVKTVTRFYPDGEVRFAGFTSNSHTGYAFAYLTFPEECPVRMEVHSTDSIKVFLGRTLVFGKDNFLKQNPSGNTLKVTMHKGVNRIAVKLSAATAMGDFTIRVIPENGMEPSVLVGAPENASQAPYVFDIVPGDLEKALNEKLEDDDRDFEALHWLFLLRMSYPLDDREGAKSVLSRMKELMPSFSLIPYLELMLLSVDPNVPEKVSQSRSIVLINQTLEKFPDHAPSLYRKALIEREQGNSEKAISILQGLIEKSPRFFWSYLLLHDIYSDLEWTDEAEKVLSSILDDFPVDSVYRTAYLFYKRNRHFKDQDAVLAAYRKIPSDFYDELYIDSLIDKGDDAGAEEALKASLRQRPDSQGEWKKLIELYERTGQLDEEEKALKAFLGEYPSDSWAEDRLGNVAYLKGNPELANAIWHQVLYREPRWFSLRKMMDLLKERTEDTGQKIDTREMIAGFEKEMSSTAELKAWDRYGGVTILDYMDLSLFSDGSGVKVVHVIEKIQSKKDADEIGEINLPEGAQIIEIRTIKKNGDIIDPEFHQGKGDLSFSGLAVGDFVEYRYIQTIRDLVGSGGYILSLGFRQWSKPIYKQMITIHTPKNLPLIVIRQNGAIEPQKTESDENITYRWILNRIEPVMPEYRSVAARDIIPIADIVVDHPSLGWLDVLDAYQSAILPKIGETFELRTALSNLFAQNGKKETSSSLESRLKKVFVFVRDHISEGEKYNLFSQTAAQIFAERKGNKSILLLAFLGLLGVKHELYMVKPKNDEDHQTPIPAYHYFWYPVIRIILSDKDIWLDPNGVYMPFDFLPEKIKGAEALQIPLSLKNDIRFIRIPAVHGKSDSWEIQVRLNIDEKGTVRGSLTMTGYGLTTSFIRKFFPNLKPPQQKLYMEQWLSEEIPGIQIDDLSISGMSDLDGPLRALFHP